MSIRQIKMILSAFLLCYAAIVFQRSTPAFSASLPGDIVDTGYAKYQGNRSFENTVAYLGIPYAEPPLAEQRFRAPIPLNTTRIEQEAGGQVVNAAQYPNFCVQGSIGGKFSFCSRYNEKYVCLLLL